ARYAAPAHGFLVSIAKPATLPFDYWAIAKAENGFRLELAGGAPPQGWEAWLRESLALPASVDVSGYADAASGDHRLLVFEGNLLLAALFVSREPVAVSRQWAVEQLSVSHADTAARFMLTAGRPAPGRPDKGAIVCSCFSVGINEITQAVRGGCWSVEKIGESLNAGTNCGSCRPEIRRIIDATQVLAAE
ncbi:MAG TPA: (2Fe-2S)-binding protein, partial [Ensifer sp.]|nr:(2Fe-2S)-binding protein [Ensifer sp.]